MKPAATIILTLLVLTIAVWAFLEFTPKGEQPQPPDAVELKLKLQDVKGRPRLVEDDDGRLVYELDVADGRTITMSPEAFSRRLYEDQTTRSWWSRLMNISTPAGIIWIAVGLLGQLLFTGRMVVQWIISEKNRKSVVPVAFWWMSLIGSTMLLTYFVWRRDVIGVLGQGTGWFIYIRNLWLIYRPRILERIAADPAPGPGTPPSHRDPDEPDLA